jgi:TolB-like protein
MPSAVTIALAPFENLSGRLDEDYLAQGFVEDLAAELSRFGVFELLYPRAVDRFLKGEAQSLPDGTHVLRGSIRCSGDVLRVGVQLVDSSSGRQVWAHRYDATAGEILTMQDDIASRIAGALAVQIDGARLAEARGFFERALAIDPCYARAYTGLSLTHFNQWSCQAWERWDEKERLAYLYASRAAELDEDDATVQVVLARVFIYRRRFDEAAHHVERALRLNSNDPDVLVHSAMCLAFLGEPGRALTLTRKARRVDPNPPPWYLAIEAVALFLLGRHAEAAEMAIGTPAAMVDLPAWIAAADAHAGNVPRARSYIDRFLRMFIERITFGRQPDAGEPLRWLLHVNPLRREEDVHRLASGVRAAGLEVDPDETRAEARARPSASGPGAIFRREGAFWTLAFDGVTVQLTDQKGFHDLARLLARPGDEIHCLELAERPREDGGPALDDRARREIQERVRELQQEIDAATAAADDRRAEQARAELDQIAEMLAGALGRVGAPARLGAVPSVRDRQ